MRSGVDRQAGRQGVRTAGRPGHRRLHPRHDRGGAVLGDMRHCRMEEQWVHAGPPAVNRGDRRTLRRNKTGTKGKTGRRKWCDGVWWRLAGLGCYVSPQRPCVSPAGAGGGGGAGGVGVREAHGRDWNN